MEILDYIEVDGVMEFFGPHQKLIQTDSLKELQLVESIIEYLESPNCDHDKFQLWVDTKLGKLYTKNMSEYGE